MNEFDNRAREWDTDKMHMDCSLAIAAKLEKMIPFDPSLKAFEYEGRCRNFKFPA